MEATGYAVQDRLLAHLKDLPWARRRVRFLLGTDVHIGRERRVAFSPDQVARLKSDLEGLGLEPEIVFVTGAGDRAASASGDDAFTDAQYEAAGATPVAEADASAQEPFDVVHALKEPTEYEATLPGPFLRIGALHLPTYPSGMCALLGARNFSAILDGAVVGNCSYRLTEGDRTPIVASMSRFAGAVAGRQVVAGAEQNGLSGGTVVVVGGGVAGRSAIREVARCADHLVVIEPWAPMRDKLVHELPGLGFAEGTYDIVTELTGALLDDAIGIVFAHRTGARAAEKVCDDAQIRRMRRGATIADIAIDQGGSIRHEGFSEADDAHTARQKYIDLFAGDYIYYGEVNMPREEPHQASIHHGRASLPYVTALLAYCAHLGSPQKVTDHLLTLEPKVYGHDEDVDLAFHEAILQDLRNGMPLAVIDGAVSITDADVQADETLRRWVEGCVGAEQ